MKVKCSEGCPSCGEAYTNGVCGNCGDIQTTNSNYQIGATLKEDQKPLER